MITTNYKIIGRNPVKLLIKYFGDNMEEYKRFEQDISIIKFIIANMSKLVKGESILLTDVIEDPQGHPHYHSRITTELYYDKEKDLLVHDEGRSGSPSCWHHYSNNEKDHEYSINILDLARNIRDDINAARCLSDDPNCKVEYIDIEGV